MTPLQELTQKIHKHCPELLELSRMCNVRMEMVVDGKSYGYMVGYMTAESMQGDPLMCYVHWNGNIHPSPQVKTDLEILGHPITLEHVLKAMNRVDAYSVGSDGRFILPGGTEWAKTPDGVFARTWDLGKHLPEQSPELIEWLNQIII